MNKIIIDQILQLQLVPDTVDDIINAKDTKKDRAVIDARIKELNKQTQKLMDLYALGSIPLDMISEKMNDINKEIDALEEEKMCLEDAVITSQEAKERLVDARKIFEEGTFEEQVALINFLIQQIILYDDKVEIYWNFE